MFEPVIAVFAFLSYAVLVSIKQFKSTVQTHQVLLTVLLAVVVLLIFAIAFILSLACYCYRQIAYSDSEKATKSFEIKKKMANLNAEVFFETSNFLKVSTASAFVDKSLLLANILNESTRMLITAPELFGKSTNLDMVKRFFSIESDKSANNETFRIFKKLQICEHHNEFCDRHFGMYPTLFIDLGMKFYISNTESVLMHFKFVIHSCYLQNSYLKNFTLSDSDMQLLAAWCDELKYKRMTKQDVVDGLANLLRMIRMYFNKNVIVLVDDYDSVINAVLFGSERDTLVLIDVVTLTTKILSSMLNTDFVERAVISGVSSIVSFGLQEIHDLKKYPFLGDHSFVNFYGLTKKEVAQLFNDPTFRLEPRRIEGAYRLYEGYLSIKGTTIFNTYSILKFLQNRRDQIFWGDCDHAFNIVNMFRYPELDSCIPDLVDYKSRVIKVPDEIHFSDISMLKLVYADKKSDLQPNMNLMLLHLFELGFLSYTNETTAVGKVSVRSPNPEVGDYLFRQVRKYCNVLQDEISEPDLNTIL